ncbi:hypothetical protein GCM10027290_38100 [Micromonospora sonneratiae]|uniref:CATRA conflict system CASPASE/TPR repeat-associated protein n=1 Tax=Micromonospora sonneratiae TaxID=1184706 RepID=A0ABW3YA82_9ACTN
MFVSRALLTHEFTRLDQPTVTPALLDTWQHLVATLEMRSDTDSGTMALGVDVPTGGLAVLGYAKRSTEDVPVHQAALSSTGDAACLTVLLAPQDPARTWAAMDSELAPLDRVAPGVDHLGSARVYVGLVDAPLDPETIAAIEKALGGEFPDVGEGAWTRHRSRTTEGFLIWEVPTTRTRQRRFVLVGEQSAELALDAFAWTPGDRELGPFVQYLLDAAKLRYQNDDHRASATAIRRLRLNMDDAVDELLELHKSATTAPGQLVAADASLTDLQVRTHGVIFTLAQLRRTARGVEAAEANLRATVSLDPAVPGPLAADLALAQTMCERLADDIAYLEISQDRAEKISALTAVAVQRGLGTHQQQLQLVQASVISSILMILAAVQAFGTVLPLPRVLQLPIIAFLGALALALPTIVLRLSRRVPRDLPLRAVDYLAASALGASTGWLGAQALAHLVLHRPLHPWWALLTSAGLGSLLAGAVWLRSRRPGPSTARRLIPRPRRARPANGPVRGQLPQQDHRT